MQINLLTNLNPIGNDIKASFKSGQFKTFKMAVAYAKNSGVNRLYDELMMFANQGGISEAIIGIDQTNTSYQALINLHSLTKSNLYIHHDKGTITFHPKMYLFGNAEIERVYIGSSNLTGGGLFTNFEANVCVDLTDSPQSIEFREQIDKYWHFLQQDENTKNASIEFIANLFQLGILNDESKKTSFKEIIGNVADLPFTSRKSIVKIPPVTEQIQINLPTLAEKFAMTLSPFDVSKKSFDPVILIPILALKKHPLFWNFPTFYMESGKGYLQLYMTAHVFIDNKVHKNQSIRIYYYAEKKEFRLKCELIKRNGNDNDIMIVEKDLEKPLEYTIRLIRQTESSYQNILNSLTEKVQSSKKVFTYF